MSDNIYSIYADDGTRVHAEPVTKVICERCGPVSTYDSKLGPYDTHRMLSRHAAQHPRKTLFDRLFRRS